MQDNLDRFLRAQERSYEGALQEIIKGKKRTHWIWFVFPVLYGLGEHQITQFFGLRGTEEAQRYIQHPALRANLIEISDALLRIDKLSAIEIFGTTDAWKVHSCMTLFRIVAPEIEVFRLVLERYYNGQFEDNTLKLMAEYD